MKDQSWVLNLKDRHNCSVLESLKPGQERDVHVIDHEAPTAKALLVKARRGSNGEDFNAALPDGLAIDMLYTDLLRRIEEEKPKV
ncbi:MAG: hypothetical protein K0S58_1288 [Nitrospira sp.]|jgi:hypothetical protein|nr:hypothetical protein [Nitrospira sp.]